MEKDRKMRIGLAVLVSSWLLGGYQSLLAANQTAPMEIKEEEKNAVAPAAADKDEMYDNLNALILGERGKAFSGMQVPVSDSVQLAADRSQENIPTVRSSIQNEDGFYVQNGNGTYNSLTRDGLWVGGTNNDTGFHVDNEGTVTIAGEEPDVKTSFGAGVMTVQNKKHQIQINSDGVSVTGNLKTDDIQLSSRQSTFMGSGLINGKVYLGADGWAENGAANTNSMAVGNGSSARGKDSTAVGTGAKVDTSQADVEAGWDKFNAAQGVAVGTNASVTGVQGTAVGYGAQASNNQTSTFGNQSQATAAGGSAFGQNASVTADNGTALGIGASAAGANSVALGAGSAVFSSDILESDKGNGVVSLGRGAADRRIINVAAGVNDDDAATVGQIKTISGVNVSKGMVLQYDNTDQSAITFGGPNGAVLKNVSDIVLGGKSMTGAGIVAGTVSDGAENSLALGKGSSIEGGVAAKSRAASDGIDGGTAIGAESSVSNHYGTALGAESSASGHSAMALGYNSKSSGEASVALGSDSTATEANVLSIGRAAGTNGKDDKGFFRKITNVADGRADTDAATYGQVKVIKTGLESAGIVGGIVGTSSHALSLGKGSSVDSGYGTAIGDAATTKGAQTSAFGASAAAGAMNATAVGASTSAYAEGSTVVGAQSRVTKEYGTVIGQNSHSYGEKATALGANAWAYGAGSVALGQGSRTAVNETNVVSVGDSGANGFTRRIINVKAGENDTDAVNKKQLDDAFSATGINKDAAGKFGATGTVFSLDYDGVDGDSNKSMIVDRGAVRFGLNEEKGTAGNGGGAVSINLDAGSDAYGRVRSISGFAVGGAGTEQTFYGQTSITYGNGKEIKLADIVQKGDLKAEAFKLADSAKASYSFRSTVSPTMLAVDDEAGGGDRNPNKDGIVNGNKTDGDFTVGKDLTVNGTTNLKNTNVDGSLNVKGDLKLNDKAVATEEYVNTATDRIQSGLDSLGGTVHKMGQEIDTVGAVSAALAGLHPIDYNGTSKLQLSAAVGAYDGTQAVAVGGFYNVRPDVRLSMGLSTSLNGGMRKTAGNIGATFLVGPGVTKSNAPSDSVLASRVAEMDANQKALQEENEQQKELLETQQRELEALKARLDAMSKK